MDPNRFDAIIRSLLTTRRALGVLLAGTAATSTFGVVAGKKKRPKCGPCQRKKKNGRCKNKPDGTACEDGSTCQNGTCLPLLSETCSASNDFCAQQWSNCLGSPQCGCFITAQGFPVCANTAPQNFSGCPAETACSADEDCLGGDICVSLPCCPQGKAVCIPFCVPV